MSPITPGALIPDQEDSAPPLPTPLPTEPTPVRAIKLTATGQGYIEVYKNNVFVSRHLQVREADETVVNLLLADPSANVEYRQVLLVKGSIV